MLWWQYITIFSFTFVLSVFSTELIRRLALRFKIVDHPAPGRKIHKKKIPLLGGLAIFISFFIVAFIFKEQLLSGDLNINHWLGVFLGAFIGAVAGEAYGGKEGAEAFKSGVGVLIGSAFMLALQIIYSVSVAIYFFFQILELILSVIGVNLRHKKKSSRIKVYFKRYPDVSGDDFL